MLTPKNWCAAISMFAMLGLALPAPAVSDSLQAVSGSQASVSAAFNGGPIVVSTSPRLSGGIISLTWNGQELLDYNPKLLRGIGANVILDRKGLCYNPNYDGARSDLFKSSSSSRLLSLKASGNVLQSSTQMAFWLTPGQTDGSRRSCGRALNDKVLSDYVIDRNVTIGVFGIPNAIEFVNTFKLAQNSPFNHNGYFVAVGAHGNGGLFKQFFSYDPAARALNSVASGLGRGGRQSRSALPVIVASADSRYALGLYSPVVGNDARPNKSSYVIGDYTETHSPTTKLNCNFYREPLTDKSYTFPCYLVVGSLSDVKNGIDQLYTHFGK